MANLTAFAREKARWTWLFLTPPRHGGVVQELAALGPGRALALSLVVVGLLCVPFAVASGWVASHVFFFGPGAPPWSPWWPATVNTLVRLLVPYPVWLALLACLHWAVAPHSTWAGRVALSCRFAFAYVLLYVGPTQYGAMLVWGLEAAGWPRIPSWGSSVVFFIWWYGQHANMLALGLLLLVAGLVGHRRTLNG